MEQQVRRIRSKLLLGIAVFWGVVALYTYAYFLWWKSIVLGAALFSSGLFIHLKHKRLEGKMAYESEKQSAMPKGEIVAGEPDLIMPASPKQPSAPGGMQKRETPSSYPRQILARFANTQRAKTVATEAEAMRQENEVRKLGLEGVRLDREVERVEWEEFTKTAQAAAAAGRIRNQADLEKMKIEVEMEELALRKEEARKKREALSKEPAPQAAPVSAEDRNRAEMKRLDERIARLQEEIRITKANPTLDEEIRVAKLNALHEQLVQAETERARLL